MLQIRQRKELTARTNHKRTIEKDLTGKFYGLHLSIRRSQAIPIIDVFSVENIRTAHIIIIIIW
jgi:hypothetical protein